MRIGVIGLGKLGLPFAEVLALRHDVLGFDIVPRESASVVVVPTLETTVSNVDVVFVALPTPHAPDYDGSAPTTQLPPRDFEYTGIDDVLAQVDYAARGGATLAVVSTVLPGTIRRSFAPRVERCELVYTPAFMAMGRVAEDFLDPEFRLLGSASGDPAAGAAVRAVWRAFDDGVPVHCVTWEEAEAIKIFYNVFVSFKLAYVNTIQDVAERIGHTDVDVVTAALAGADRRITSDMYLRAGMGDGGPCHPRDLIALRHLAQELELGYDLFGSIAATREAQARNVAEALLGLELPVALTSRSFKPGVPFVDGSSALLVAHYVEAAGRPVRFLDDGVLPDEPHVVLLVHDVDHSGLDVPGGSVIVDPWRRYRSTRHRVVHYGNTKTRA
jgi:UDPglucose 6-dehydrogenase